ncbi:toxin-antitoxin system YwqK family antitoxin [Zobellia alginiliquefaciens]|uniref:toxin-antitoxin system YwqK family antitoxin n=1 Tax=Zobellia alginiliquefaciens TaxID=3032586 RepID=UPI0023E37031|nr:toxin-antitoxin system YwqK family antitoxin [Zobellia alginiliquefaciens]
MLKKLCGKLYLIPLCIVFFACAQMPKKNYYENGQIKEEGQIVKNKKEGLWKEFYKDGTIKSTINYKEGKRHGDLLVYYDNGNLAKKGEIIKDTITIGMWQWFYKNKQLKIEGAFDIQGNQKDIWKTFYEDGSKMSIANFPDGSHLKYHKDGTTIKEKGSYKKGERQGQWKSYYKSGILKYDSKYENGRKYGIQQKFYDNGQLEQIADYVNGEPHAELKNYSDDGKLESLFFYNNGEIIWKKVFYEEGGIKEHITYEKVSNDSVVKLTKTYYANGQIDEEYFFDNKKKYN